MPKKQNHNVSSNNIDELLALKKSELERRKSGVLLARAFRMICIALTAGVILYVAKSFYVLYQVTQILQIAPSREELILIFTMIFLISLIIFFILKIRTLNADLRSINAVMNGETPQQLEAAKQAESKALADRHRRAERLLKRCEEAGISSLDTEVDKSNMWIIAGSMGIESKEEAFALYREGLNPSQEAIVAVDKERTEERASQRRIECDDLERRLMDFPPSLIGRSKYTAWAVSLKTRIRDEIEGYEASSKLMSMYPSTIQTPQKNVTKEAIKGQLLGGAGLATVKAIEAQSFNTQSSATSASIAAGMSKLSSAYSRKVDKLKLLSGTTNRYLRTVNSKLIDTENSEKYASMIDARVSKARLSSGGNLKLDIDFKIMGEPEILGKEAFLDGVIDITATLDGKPIGSRTYCRPLSNCPSNSDSLTDDLNTIYFLGKVYTGLKNDLHIKPLMIVTADITEADIPNIVFEITPRTVWAVEGTRDGLLYEF